MGEIVNKFLSAGDRFMPEMHLMHPWLMHSACGQFTKNKERMQKFKEKGDSRDIDQNKPDQAYFLMEILRICLEEQLLI